VAAARLYTARAAVIRRVLGNAAVAAWDDIEDYRDGAELEAFVDRMAPLSEAAQRSLAHTLAGYLQAATGDDLEDFDVEEVTGDAVRAEGIAHDWAIPGYSVWKRLGEGIAYADAVEQGRADVAIKAETDLALAQRDAMADIGRQLPGVAGYRRVPTSSACEFCNEVAERTYAAEDLMPVHANCQCSVVPIVLREDGTEMDPSEAFDFLDPPF
jgi:hypothetical protein